VHIVRVLVNLQHILISKKHKENHAMSENEQYYGIIEIACVHT
jgi:hypothetical protein